MGQSLPPCPPDGCQPPADTKVEFTLHSLSDSRAAWYDVSLVDGYSIPAEIVPSREDNTCTRTHCAVTFSNCPQNENHVGDLRLEKNNRIVSCLSPCKKWNWPRQVFYITNILKVYIFSRHSNHMQLQIVTSVRLDWVDQKIRMKVVGFAVRIQSHLRTVGRTLSWIQNTSRWFIKTAQLHTHTHMMMKLGSTIVHRM